MRTYLDSSALVSLYIVDAHSKQAIQQMSSAPSTILTSFSRAEFANAIYQQVFLKRIPLDEADAAFANFERDCLRGLWRLVEIPQPTWERCVILARQYGSTFGVRMLDLLHVACALELGAQRFWTFDERQERLAIAAGLNTNP